MAPAHSPPSPLGYLVPPSSPVLPYVASPNVEAASSAPVSSNAALIASPPVLSSLFPGVAAAPAVAEAPAIVMPPGLKPPPGNGPLNLGIPSGVRRLQVPAHQQSSYQRQPTYQPDYAGYYNDERRRTAARRQLLQGYRNSLNSYSQRQWALNRYYPTSNYQRMDITSSKNTIQRRYRQTDDADLHDQGNPKLHKSRGEKSCDFTKI